MSPARLLKLLAILAMLIAPLGMIGGGPAMAANHPAAAAATAEAAHCAEMDQPSKEHSGPAIDCMIACAALPAFGNELPVQVDMPSPALPRPLDTAARGLNSAAEPPPPRLS